MLSVLESCTVRAFMNSWQMTAQHWGTAAREFRCNGLGETSRVRFLIILNYPFQAIGGSAVGTIAQFLMILAGINHSRLCCEYLEGHYMGCRIHRVQAILIRGPASSRGI